MYLELISADYNRDIYYNSHKNASVYCKSNILVMDIKEAQLPQRNSASAPHVYLGWLTDRAVQRTP